MAQLGTKLNFETTAARFEAVVRLLLEHCEFQIHHVVQIGSEAKYKYCVTTFKKNANRDSVLTKDGELWRTMPLAQAALSILRLMRQNHDVLVDQLWDDFKGNGAGRTFSLIYPESQAIITAENHIMRFTAFTDCTDREALKQVNEKIQADNVRHEAIIQEQCQKIWDSLETYQARRKEWQQWDEEGALNAQIHA